MAEYIQREAILRLIGTPPSSPTTEREDRLISAFVSTVENFPAADVRPVVKGEWIISIGNNGKPVGTICPICGFAWAEEIDAVKLEPALSLIRTPYCPNCGARMEGKDG